jgi:hypothetical protein
MDDDDGPPMLVDSNGVDNEDANLNAEMEDAKPTKVPISIITGELERSFFRSPVLVDWRDLFTESVTFDRGKNEIGRRLEASNSPLPSIMIVCQLHITNMLSITY